MLLFTFQHSAQDLTKDFVQALNQLRHAGCRCAGKSMPPVGSVKYNGKLSLSAQNHAEEIRSQRRLNHYSREGWDIGQRISRVGYKWEVVGENLAYGQVSISEVIQDWIASKSHCTILMDPRFREFGLAKIGPYWVLHFGQRKRF